jgi:hypothetical protein
MATVLCIVAFRQFQRSRPIQLSQEERRFSKEAIHEGLRCLGYALSPSSESDMAAMDQGHSLVKNNGMAEIIAVSIVAMGMAQYYASNKNLKAVTIQVMLLHINEICAAEFSRDATILWDMRNETLNGRDAKILLENSSRRGFHSCRDIQAGSPLRDAMIAVATCKI